MTTPPNTNGLLLREATPTPRPARLEVVQIADAELLACVENDNSLSEVTRAQYLALYQRLVHGSPGKKGSQPQPALIQPAASLLWVLTHPQQASEQLCAELRRRGSCSPHHLHIYLQAIRACIARHPKLCKLAQVRDEWAAIAQQLATTPLAEAAQLNRPSQRQLKAHVPYEQIAAAFKRLCREEPGSMDCLLVGLVGLGLESSELLPQRCDYGAVRLVFGGGESPPAAGNYLLLTRDTAHILLREYKTAKKFGPRRIELPPSYLMALLESLRQEPRDWLFTKRYPKAERNRPYQQASSWGKWAANRLQHIFGRRLTLTACRHSYISYLHASDLWADMSDQERQRTAHNMGHSFSTACRYRFARRYLPS